MASDSSDGPNSYRGRVTIGVLNAIVVAGRAEDADVGMVELQTALIGACDAIAMLVAAAQVDQTQSDRRDTADLCRKRILLSSNEIARRIAAGEELPWKLDALGTAH